MPFTLRSPSWYEVLVLAGLSFVLIILALYVMSKKSLPKTIELFGVVIITQVLLMGPLLIASQNQVEPRFLVQGQWLTAYLSILGSLNVFLSLGSKLPFFF
jgi:multisubunit Na+/H+ antiporter MnhB subunit